MSLNSIEVGLLSNLDNGLENETEHPLVLYLKFLILYVLDYDFTKYLNTSGLN